MAASAVDYKFCPHCGRRLAIRIEEEKERKFCQHCVWTYYPSESIAPAGIMETRGKVLLVQRNREPNKGKWQLPSGFKDYGETVAEALRRELKEELDVILTGHEFLDEIRSSEDPRNAGVLVDFFIVEWDGEPINNEPAENQAVGWFDVNGLPPIAWKAHLRIIKYLQSYLKS